MKIISLECLARRMELAEPYSIAYESIDHCTNLFMKAETEKGLTGWGCSAPDKVVTGESPESVMRFYKDCIEPLLRGADPWRYLYLLEEAKKVNPTAFSALAMMDMALLDLISRDACVPLFKFLGGYREKIETSVTIGILPVEETLASARNWRKKGFRILKIKGGKDFHEDIERVVKLREEFGESIEIRFDANQGYQVEEALAFMEGTRQTGIKILEQPTPVAHEKLLGIVTRNIPEPVMADESLITLRDAFRLTRNELADMINIKLMKVGGINEAIHINSVAKSAGVDSMVGCMDESVLGISAGLHFALSKPNIQYADLDGHLGLVNDPFSGLIRLKKGILSPGEGHGLGPIRDPF
jgi:L-Ala-D/L-Glu epimerase